MHRLTAFYHEAEEVLTALAEKHEVWLPQGHASRETGLLHWRLSVYEENPASNWAKNWALHASALGVGAAIEPGDIVLDQEGRTWTLLGLDVSSPDAPVRLRDAKGQDYMAPIGGAVEFQVLAKHRESEIGNEQD